MAYKFERLAEVETMDSVPEGASVLAEVNGAVVRVPSDGMKGSVPDRIKLLVTVQNDAPTAITPFSRYILSSLFDDDNRWNNFEICTRSENPDSRYDYQYKEGYASAQFIHWDFDNDGENTCIPYIVLTYMSFDDTKLLCSKIKLKEGTKYEYKEDENGDEYRVEVPVFQFDSASAPVEVCSFA